MPDQKTFVLSKRGNITALRKIFWEAYVFLSFPKKPFEDFVTRLCHIQTCLVRVLNMATFDLSKLPQLLSHGTVCKGDWLCTKLSITMCKW